MNSRLLRIAACSRSPSRLPAATDADQRPARTSPDCTRKRRRRLAAIALPVRSHRRKEGCLIPSCSMPAAPGARQAHWRLPLPLSKPVGSPEDARHTMNRSRRALSWGAPLAIATLILSLGAAPLFVGAADHLDAPSLGHVSVDAAGNVSVEKLG